MRWLLVLQLVGTGGIGYGPNLPATCAPGDVFAASGTPSLSVCAAQNTWATMATTAQTMQSGTIVMILTGTCPSGYAEVSALNGVMVRGTLAANGNVGSTGGSDTATPTVASLTAAAQTFTGGQGTTSATSGGTPAGTNGTGTVTPLGTVAWPVGVPTFSGSALATHAHELPWQIPSTTTIRQIAVATFGTGTSRAATAVSAAGTGNTTSAAVALSQAISAGTPAGTVAWPAGVPTLAGSSSVTSAEVFTGSALGTHTHTVTPTGTNGTSAVTGTLNSISTVPSYVNVIFCSKS